MSAGSPIVDPAEEQRLREADDAEGRRREPCLFRSRGSTSRRDGPAWRTLPHNHARLLGYRWREDGITGFCDVRQHGRLLSPGFWNGVGAVRRERLSGLADVKGNHGEEVKEIWWNLGAAPIHPDQRRLHRDPQAPVPYADSLAEDTRRQGADARECGIEDSAVSPEPRSFDVEVACANEAPGDILTSP
ncbi:hypothetical protein [Aureimonas pseudogalii]|uniref:Uncharacterized protein n=1 Tax=Aureimonas pseudogalii TaxID=1744844 RepID=A0A7W6H2V9_9HYPH|nr:hypothetical protein [Aureimonas pseudogalii]MBB3997070.1 hypothetical protein [Aureimonas pseudogalii]